MTQQLTVRESPQVVNEVTPRELTNAARNFRGMKSFFDYLSQMCDAMADRCDRMAGGDDNGTEGTEEDEQTVTENASHS